MYTLSYKYGASSARKFLGLEPEEDHTVRNVAIGGIATTPFAGLIGRKKIHITPESGPRFENIEALSHHAQPGDILLSADTGNPAGTSIGGTDIAHASPVVGTRQGHGLISLPSTEKLPPTDVEGMLKRAPEATEPTKLFGSDRLVLVRPKTPYTPEQLRTFTERGLQEGERIFSSPHAIHSAFREIYFPKLKVLESNKPKCEGPICSSISANALEAGGKPSITGKPLEHALPYDFARSDKFDVIGHAVAPGARKVTSRASQLARQIGLRAALGLGGAGALYAATEDPAIAMGAGGAALTPMLARQLLGSGSKSRFALPPFLRAFNVSPNVGAIRRKILARSLPLALAGGGLTYLAGRHFLGDK